MSDHAEEEVTAVWPAARDRNERLAVVLDRYMRELENSGLPPDVDKLVREHPDLAEELRSYVDSLQMLHQMTAGLRPAPSTPANGSPAGGSLVGAKRLGDYEIVREVGRGGMGVVYEARQLSLNRQVALKVLPFAAMLDERQIVRFRTEAQAAAQLHHPNIVPVHAVGQERGVHYFAMQFIAGQSLECALNELRGAAAPRREGEAPAEPHRQERLSGSVALPTLERDRDTAVGPAFSTRVSARSRTYCHSVARLMLQAAEALHHAHQLGVVHRDIKPSNLLLDRDGKLWITDFGLARIQSDSGVTISGDIVGTIRYMSPEQAAGTPALVDARSDVYALGATLYELLTLRPAHPGDARQEILHTIESVEPASPRSVNPSVPFDLETITLRALAKSRDERYGTAQELADDLQRFLAGEPTRARRPTAADRMAKWALRHRKSVALAAGFLIALTIVSASAAIMTRRAWLASERSLVQADKDFKLARLVVDRSTALSNELVALPGAERFRRDLLKDTREYYKQFISRAKNDPKLAVELAGAYHKAAVIAETLGERGEALDMCRQALAAFETIAANSPDDEQLRAQQARVYSSLGQLLSAEGEGDAALDAYAQAIELQRALAARQPGAAAPERALAESYSNLGLLQGRLGDKQQARQALQSSIDLINDLLAHDPTNAQLRHDAAIGHNNLSFVERGEDWASSEKSCREAIALLEALVEENPSALSYRSDLALCYNNHGAILGHRQEWKSACDSYEQAIELQRQLTRQAGAVVSYRRDLAVSLNNLGQAQQELAELAPAIESFDAAEEIARQLIEDFPDELTFRSLGGAVLNNRAMALEANGQSDESLAVYEQAIEHQRLAHERAPQITEYREILSKHYFNYGRALRAAGRPADAADAALERRKLWPEHGEHLGQVAIELAQAAALLRVEADGSQRAAELEAAAADAVRDAAASGADLAALRASKELDFLNDEAFDLNFGAPPESVVQ